MKFIYTVVFFTSYTNIFFFFIILSTKSIYIQLSGRVAFIRLCLEIWTNPYHSFKLPLVQISYGVWINCIWRKGLAIACHLNTNHRTNYYTNNWILMAFKINVKILCNILIKLVDYQKILPWYLHLYQSWHISKSIKANLEKSIVIP